MVNINGLLCFVAGFCYVWLISTAIFIVTAVLVSSKSVSKLTDCPHESSRDGVKAWIVYSTGPKWDEARSSIHD